MTLNKCNDGNKKVKEEENKINYEKMWKDMLLYIEEMKIFSESVDAKGVPNVNGYKQGLITAHELMSKTAKGLETEEYKRISNQI